MKEKIKLILTIVVLLFSFNGAKAGNGQQNPDNALLLININNPDKFFEFQFHSGSHKIEKICESKVEKAIKDERTHLVWSSLGFYERYSAKLKKRESIVNKYRGTFSLDDYSIAAISGDGKYIGYTRKFNKEVLYVASLQDSKALFSIRPSEGEYINDAEWANDSIALITVHSRMGYWPWELLAAVAGHPIPHNTLYIEIYSLQGNLLSADLIWKNITYGQGTLIKLSERSVPMDHGIRPHSQ